MPRAKEPTNIYASKPKSQTHISRKRREFVLDDRGRRVGVILDLTSYERLMEAKEELEDIREFDESAGRAKAEYKKGEYVTLEEYKRQRKPRGR